MSWSSVPAGDGESPASAVQGPGYWSVSGEGTGGVDLGSVYLECCNCLFARLQF